MLGSVEKGELLEKRRSGMKIKLGNDVCHYPHFAFFLNVHYEATYENGRIMIGTCEMCNNHSRNGIRSPLKGLCSPQTA